MEFQNDFDVQAPLEQVWDTMLDIERVAPCVPGASVLERTGDDAYKVAIKVKVGPVSMEYRGDVEIVEKDPASHTAVMSARAREARGQGTANANVRTALSANGDTTHGAIVTEVQLSGRAAAMGQGVIKDVSEKIIDQFAANLAAMLGGGGEAAAAGAAESAEGRGQIAEAPAEAPSTPPSAAHAEVAPETPTPAAPPSDEGLDVLPIVRSLAADRLRDPRVVGIGLLALLFLLFRRRR